MQRKSGPPLNPAQRDAVDKAAQHFDHFQAILLDGVTGSGKTEVYLQGIRHALDAGKGAIGTPAVSYDGAWIYFPMAREDGAFFHIYRIPSIGGEFDLSIGSMVAFAGLFFGAATVTFGLPLIVAIPRLMASKR